MALALRLAALGCLFATGAFALASPRSSSRKTARIAKGEYSLASPKSTSSQKRNKRTSDGSGGGFASVGRGKAGEAPPPSIDNDEEDAKRAVKNLFSVCSHIQNPELYQPSWADNARLDETGKVVASTDTKTGTVLTLFPVHALGLRTLHRNVDAKKKRKHRREDTEFVAFDVDRDGEYFQASDQQAGLRMKLNIPLDETQPAAAPILGSGGGRKNKALFAMLFRDEVVPGWLGGRVRSSSTQQNCVVLPLPGAAPLCAVVATRDVEAGEEVVQGVKPPDAKVLDECRSTLAKEHGEELLELNGYIEMACKSTPTATSDATTVTADSVQLGPFHSINQRYPGLKRLHQDPDIYTVDNFLSEDECDRLIAKATPHLRPCMIKNESTGTVEQDPSRTSVDANMQQAEAPSIVSKLEELANCNADHLETLQTLRYTSGQEFKPHTDGYAGPVTACGFERANRLVTIFCYLNDVERGGSTYFPDCDLQVRPKKGMAVIHFPSDVELREDERTVHQGMPAMDEKWLLATWVWSKPRLEGGQCSEGQLPSLSSDVI
ncbi:hypothetical protein ACHAXT_003884 [Thalassiosira profunda]